ncbi:hypothetical protein [Rhizobium leguminosarum]|jgi:hypothetical protein|uniref:hypothetical protein n=1 Tax=Rhizobium leguminosarum TaxID=384 RepID=UPI002E0E82CA|nr:hypothetical protein U8Q02_36745 [Rhizobium leguminosarum]
MDDNHGVSEPERSSIQRLVDAKKKQIQSDVKGMVRDDLIGVSDWKSSKIGSLTGFSAASRAMKGLGDNLANSTQHLGGLLEGMTAREQLPSLPEDIIAADDEVRFEASRRQQGLTETKIAIALRNTFWSVYLFGFSSALYVVMMAYWDIVSPPKDIVAFVVRFGFLPFLLALCFKHAYTNWILRHRVLPKTPLKFLRSLDFLPSK